MTAHRIASITIDQFGVNPVVDCLAEPGAWCGWECPDRCDDDVPFAPTDTPPDNPCCFGCGRPLVAYGGGCVVVEWWSDTDWYAMAYGGRPHPFAPGPIEVSTDGGRYVWRYADEAGPDPESAS